MIDKCTGNDGSTNFIDFIMSVRFDLTAEFDNESSHTKDCLKMKIYGAVDTTNDEENNEIGKALSALCDATT